MKNLGLLQKNFNTIPDSLNKASRNLHRKTHQTIRKVSGDMDSHFHFNTAISAIMELVNALFTETGENAGEIVEPDVIRESVESILLLLAPMVPHFCEELWQLTGHIRPLSETPWPEFDTQAAKDDEITLVVQVNGKVRSRLLVPADQDSEELKKKALADQKVRKFIGDKEIRKTIVVKNKLINIVVS